ncbi:MAG: 30S ribosomal protein S6 [Myxococcales bacterium]|nr:30S ribosomal protein S6 [Myxococcales bacterium]MCB9566128.1 30S ribosomal protein S6 [Myxococcales bacterium]MCB9703986.1 30S ribosomal protein S6 [Myxococcales bacterium]
MSNTQGQVLSMGSLRGTKREYETVTILRPASNKTDILDLVGKVQGIFKDFDATLVQIENWGSRTLAYPIKRSNTGIYLYWRYLGGSDVVREVERNLEIIDMVLRYTTVKVDEDVDPNARPSEVTEDLLNAAAEPPPEPVEEVDTRSDEDYEDDDSDESED